MALFPSDVSRLIYYYLLSEGYENTASTLTGECPHLKGFQGLANNRSTGRRYSRMIGPSLTELLEEYFCTKDLVAEQLESIEDANPVRPQDSLPTLTTHVFRWLKSQIDQQQTKVQTCEAFTLTDCAESKLAGKDAEVQVQERDFIAENELETPPPVIDLSLIYENLMENEALHHRIAENINAVISGRSAGTPELSSAASLSNSDFSQDLNTAVKVIAEKTQADPIFESVILGLLGEGTDPSSPEDATPSAVEPEPRVIDVMDMCPSPTHLPEDPVRIEPTSKSIEPPAVQETSLVPYVPCSVPLIMPSLAVIPADSIQCSVFPTVLPAYPSTAPPLRRLMPKMPDPPQISISIPEKQCPLSVAVSETLPEFQKEFTFQPDDPQQPPITLRVLTSPAKAPERGEPEPPKSKPKKVVMKCTRRRTRLTTRTVKSTKAVPQEPERPAGVSSMFRELLTVTTEFCKNKADEGSVAVTGVASQSSIESVTSSTSEDPPPSKTPPATLSAKKRRSGHVRQLDFGKSPQVKASPGSLTAQTSVVSSPNAGTCQAAIASPGSSAVQQTAISSSPGSQRAVLPVSRSPGISQSSGPSTGTSTTVSSVSGSCIKTWDAALRTAVSSSLDDSIFATPRGKAKRACVKPTSAEKSSEAVPRTPSVAAESSSSMPGLATPHKPGETSNSSWGVPLTPRVILDGNSSSSPFLFSFTKGFQFLTDTPVLNTPATPTIRNGSDSKQSDMALNTPRVELLRQEAATSSSLGTCTISPTQVVLGKSTPYFVPSGERAKRPESAGVTPERRLDDRSEQPLQAGENTVQVAREMMSEETLETILIEVCSDLQKRDKRKTPAKSKLVELFGEDSQGGGGEGTSGVPARGKAKEKLKSKRSRTRSKSPVVSNENFIQELLETTRREMAAPESGARKRVRKPSLERDNPTKKREVTTKEKEVEPKKNRRNAKKPSPVKESPFANLEKQLQITRPPLGRKAVSLKQSHLASSYLSPARPRDGANTADQLEAALERMHGESCVLPSSNGTVGTAEAVTPSAVQPVTCPGEVQPANASDSVIPPEELVQADAAVTSSPSSSPACPIEQNIPEEETPLAVESRQIAPIRSAEHGVEDQNLKILAAAAAECESSSSAKSACSPNTPKKKRRSHSRLGSLENYLTLINFAESSAVKSTRNGTVSKETSTAQDGITDRVNAEMNAMSRRVQQRLQEKNIDLFLC